MNTLKVYEKSYMVVFVYL